MSNSSHLESIFFAALEKPSLAERRAYLDEACAGDADLCGRVERMLAAQADAGSFLDHPPIASDATIHHEPSITESPGTVIGPYKLLQQIGEGGMGVVFMAEQTEPIQRTVALKIIKPGMDTRQVIARFEAERQALAMMDHPNIAKVLDAGTTDSGRPYFVMELVKGVPITKYCDEKHLPLRARLELLLPVCQAVQHAHQKGVIHRDIKPTNVLVAEYDDQAVPKVIDFGVAKATAQKLTDRTMFTEFGQVVGTVEYMSPEQAKFNQLDIDTRSDIYSLGVLLYELLTGSTPFGRKRLQEAAFDEALRIIREEEPQKPSTRLSTTDQLPSIAANRHSEPARLSKDVRGELDWVVMKALEKDRNRRYETANGLARDVERYLHDEPVQACPPSATYRFRKFARRNKVALMGATAAMATLVLLVLGLAVSNLLIVAERNQKAEALIEKEQALAAAKASEEAAQAESQRAEKGFLRASIAISEIMTKAAMGLGEWSQLPAPLRKRFAEEATKFYEELLQESNPNPSLRYETAVGYRSIGAMQTTSGELPQAEASYRHSVAILDPLVTEHPAVQEYRHQLAWSLLNLGRTLRNTKRSDEAKTALHKGAELYETLLGKTSRSSNPRSEMATCYLELSRCYGDTRDFKPAAEAINRGIAVLEAAVPKEADMPAYKEHLAGLHLALGQMLAGNGQVKDAKAAFRTAAEHYEYAFSKRHTAGILEHWMECYGGLLDLPNDDPQIGIAESEQAYQAFLKIYSLTPADRADHILRVQSGHFRRTFAYKLWYAGRRNEAEQLLGEAAAVFEKLMTDEPDYASNWQFAADTQRWAAEWMILRGRHEQAEQALRRSIEIHKQRMAKFPNLVIDEGDRASSYCTLARLLATSPLPQQRNPTQAIELAKKAVEIQPTKRGCWSVLGTAHYRAGNWKESVEATEKCIELRAPSDSDSSFVLAMAYWQLGKKAEARTQYDRMVKWLDKNPSKTKELRRIRTEAAELLGITETRPPAPSATSNKQTQKTDDPTQETPPTTDDGTKH